MIGTAFVLPTYGMPCCGHRIAEHTDDQSNWGKGAPPACSCCMGAARLGAALLLMDDPLSFFDLRMRSLDRNPGDPISLCSECEADADWSVWLHTPEWGNSGGLTLVRCTGHALEAITTVAVSVTHGSPTDSAPSPESS